jgi:hypothetical protein
VCDGVTPSSSLVLNVSFVGGNRRAQPRPQGRLPNIGSHMATLQHDMDIRDEAELTPPTFERVVSRAIVLSAAVCRAYIEENADDPKAETFRQKMMPWIEAQGALTELEPRERIRLDQPLGQLGSQVRVDFTWRSEGLAILAWYLGCITLPEQREPVIPSNVANSLYFTQDTARAELLCADVRSDEEFLIQYQRHLAIHWRLREYSLSGARIDFLELARTAWFGPLNITRTRLIENDLAIGAEPLFRARQSTIQQCLGIAQERHRAVNWLAGYDPVYSEVDVST